MKIVILDPNLDRFGHHIHFNSHLIRLFEQPSMEVTYLDVGGIMQDATPQGSTVFRQLTEMDMGRSSDRALTSATFAALQSSTENCTAFWNMIADLGPDLVLCSSEGNRRKQVFGSIPPCLSDKVFVIVHPVWSIIAQLDSQPELAEIYRNRLGGMLVLEPFLVDKLANHGIRTFWLPHRSFTTDQTLKPYTPRQTNERLRLGTVGVINQRRNHSFIIRALAGLEDTDFSYHLAGQLMDSVRPEITEALARFKDKHPNALRTDLGYLDDLHFDQVLSELDLCILAYDDQRNLQASGAVYSFIEANLPVLAPDTELFKLYARDYPAHIRLYSALDEHSLRSAIRNFKTEGADQSRKLGAARDRALVLNELCQHQAYIRSLTEALTSTESAEAANALALSGRLALATGNPISAEGYYLAAAEIAPSSEDIMLAAVELRNSNNDPAGASHLRTRILAKNFSAFPDLSNRIRSGRVGEIFVWPAFNSHQALDDFLTRFSWHFMPIANYISRVHVFVEQGDSEPAQPSSVLARRARECRNWFSGKLFIRPSSMFPEVPTQAALFSVVWKYDTPEQRKKPFPDCSTASQLYKLPIWRVDEENERFATSHFLKAGSEAIVLDNYRSQSHQSFLRLARNFTQNHAAVFGTGPSLSNAWKHDFAQVDTIAANSMVKNIGLLDHLKPKLIVCADPIFHAGASTYAEEFRHHLHFALKRYDCSLMVPERDRHIYQDYFAGEGFDIFSAPLVHRTNPNYDLCGDFSVTSTGNILTLFLLQVAFSLAHEVDIYGCDGRPQTENSYFWGHDKSAQLNEHMTDIQRAHPGFFKISYDEYYNEHCATLEHFLSFAEQNGRIVRSKTFSYIPALIAREYKMILGGQPTPTPDGVDVNARIIRASASALIDPAAFAQRLSQDTGFRDSLLAARKTLGETHPHTSHFDKTMAYLKIAPSLYDPPARPTAKGA